MRPILIDAFTRLKLFLSSFESAWTPFHFGVMREPNAKDAFSRVTTYGVLILAVLTAGLSAYARDFIALATTPTFHHAARVIPWVAVGVAPEGVSTELAGEMVAAPTTDSAELVDEAPELGARSPAAR